MLQQTRRHSHLRLHHLIDFSIVERCLKIVGLHSLLKRIVEPQRNDKRVAHRAFLLHNAVTGAETQIVKRYRRAHHCFSSSFCSIHTYAPKSRLPEAKRSLPSMSKRAASGHSVMSPLPMASLSFFRR